MAIAPLIGGPLIEKASATGDYTAFYLVFLAFGVVATIVSVYLYILDKKRGSPLNKVEKNKKTIIGLKKSMTSFA